MDCFAFEVFGGPFCHIGVLMTGPCLSHYELFCSRGTAILWALRI